jgi:PDZ domain-containing protein
LADLPIGVLETPLEGRLNLGVLEADQRDDRPPTDRRPVLQRAEHRAQTPSVANRPQRRHRRLSAPGIGVVGCHRGQAPDRLRRTVLAESPSRRFGDQGVGVAETGDEGGTERRGLAHACMCRQDGGTVPDRGVRVAEPPHHLGRRERAGSLEGTEPGRTDRGVVVVPGGLDRLQVAPMAGGDDPPPARKCGRLAAAFGSGHGRIIGHAPSMTDASPAPPAASRRHRARRALVALVVVVVVLVVVASRINLGYFVISPGEAQSVTPLITVPAHQDHRVRGAVMLTDVFEAQVSALSYLFDRLSPNDQLIPTDELVPPGIPASELTAQGYLEMAQAKAAAETAALRRLGYPVPEHDAGVVIEGVASSTPAFGVLAVGQVITAVDAVATPTVCRFVAALSALRPGAFARLTVRQDRFSGSGRLIRGSLVTRRIRLARRPRGVPRPTGCSGVRRNGGYLGVVIATQQDFTYPFPISIDTADIGGPSAGLAMTLGLLDLLGGGRLTGGRRVAATGTIDPAGDVGDVGGVAQKTVAVERAGATVFFVPVDELAAASSKKTPSLHVYGVRSLAQVLAILFHMGGRLVPRPSPSPE